ncbi:MAG: type I-E CRISPR-associated endonuclease Cas1e [Chloroflexi bacterium]|nr:type I-E CRISPR-associated endonuclease Cas1e [Chloroflexota bacterium]
MRLTDLHELPKVRDSWSYLYVEHGRIDQDAKAIALHDANGKTAIPCAALTTLMLGPGTSITHAAIKTLADCGCLVVWTGEEGVRFYAQGLGETRSSRRLLTQAKLWADPKSRLRVVFRMYQMRFDEALDPSTTLRQVRGKEGIRVRETYARLSRETGVVWKGRSYRRGRWGASDPINRALSAANSCLYGVCHAAIVSAGYSPALGFIHTGKMRSFVYDVADLYKTETSIPAAFNAVAEGVADLEGTVRRRCRDYFHARKLMSRIVADIERVLAVPVGEPHTPLDSDLALPGGIWDPEAGAVEGGVNYAELLEGQHDGHAAGASVAKSPR